MHDVEKITNEAGQDISILTLDQQLYRVAIDIIWNDPQRWSKFVVRLGGMHF